MYKNQLEKFFKDTYSKDGLPTAAALAHFQIKMNQNPETGNILNSMINETVFEMNPAREKETESGKLEIESLTNSTQVVKLMRRGVDLMNQQALVDKALEFEEEIIPDIMNRFMTSLNSKFIEVSTKILLKSEMVTPEKLSEMLDNIRNPYAQSMILLIMGFKADESYVPWLIDKYYEFKKRYPGESHCDGAYYALCEMDERFY